MHWLAGFKLKGGIAVTLLILVLFSRIAAFCVLDRWDVVNDSGVGIKPLGVPAYLDYAVYRMHIGSAWNEMSRPFLFIQRALSNFEQAFSWLHEQAFKPGPIFPEILGLWGYERIHAWLASVYLLAGCALGCAWAVCVFR